jgi:hypothetical protein
LGGDWPGKRNRKDSYWQSKHHPNFNTFELVSV